MLDWLGRRRSDKALQAAAAAVESSVESLLRKGKTLTYDLGGTAKCSQVGTAVAGEIIAAAKRGR